VVIAPAPETLSFGEAVVVQTLAGLVARSSPGPGRRELVWIERPGSPSYDEWFRRCRARLEFEVVSGKHDVWGLVRRFVKSGILEGYVLYRKDPSRRGPYEGTPEDVSLNIATSLCSVLPVVAVEASLEEKAKRAGLVMRGDARDQDARWLLKRYGAAFSKIVLGSIDPLTPIARDAAVANRALVSRGPLSFARLDPGAAVLGWGFGDEAGFTRRATVRGAFQTATNWCFNLPVLSAGDTGLGYRVKDRKEAPARSAGREDPDTRYVAFLLSDGDNVQWAMSGYLRGESGRHYWGSPDRGRIPFGWGLPVVDLLQLCPYALDYVAETATSRDDLVLYGAGGYYYPDLFASERKERRVLARHARRTCKYMQAAHIDKMALIAMDWDGDAARSAYRVYAREMPGLEAVFAMQYYPYSAGRGRVLRIGRDKGPDLLVISPRFSLWANRRDTDRAGTPEKIAAEIDRWAARPARSPEDRVALIIVHAWSWFEEGGVKARGYRPAFWCARRLEGKVRVCTPAELVDRLKK